VRSDGKLPVVKRVASAADTPPAQPKRKRAHVATRSQQQQHQRQSVLAANESRSQSTQSYAAPWTPSVRSATARDARAEPPVNAAVNDPSSQAQAGAPVAADKNEDDHDRAQAARAASPTASLASTTQSHVSDDNDGNVDTQRSYTANTLGRKRTVSTSAARSALKLPHDDDVTPRRGVKRVRVSAAITTIPRRRLARNADGTFATTEQVSVRVCVRR
jgi:hypothetical protein